MGVIFLIIPSFLHLGTNIEIACFKSLCKPLEIMSLKLSQSTIHLTVLNLGDELQINVNHTVSMIATLENPQAN